MILEKQKTLKFAENPNNFHENEKRHIISVSIVSRLKSAFQKNEIIVRRDLSVGDRPIGCINFDVSGEI
jgi:hypothetical protein